MNDLLTREQAAAFCGMSEEFLRNCARTRRNGPPYFRYSNKSVLYRRDELLAWMESRRVEPIAEAVEDAMVRILACSPPPAPAPGDIDGRTPEENLRRKVADLALSRRSRNCLSAAGVVTVNDLVQKTEQDLLVMSAFGQRSLDEIKRLLAMMGLRLGLKPAPQAPAQYDLFDRDFTVTAAAI